MFAQCPINIKDSPGYRAHRSFWALKKKEESPAFLISIGHVRWSVRKVCPHLKDRFTFWKKKCIYFFVWSLQSVALAISRLRVQCQDPAGERPARTSDGQAVT